MMIIAAGNTPIEEEARKIFGASFKLVHTYTTLETVVTKCVDKDITFAILLSAYSHSHYILSSCEVARTIGCDPVIITINITDDALCTLNSILIEEGWEHYTWEEFKAKFAS